MLSCWFCPIMEVLEHSWWAGRAVQAVPHCNGMLLRAGCGQPPIPAALLAAPCPSFNHNVWFCSVLSKPGSCLETGRVLSGCTQNQEFQISAESDRGESHFPLNRWEGLLPWLWYACTCARGTSKTALALFSPGVPVRA